MEVTRSEKWMVGFLASLFVHFFGKPGFGDDLVLFSLYSAWYLTCVVSIHFRVENRGEVIEFLIFLPRISYCHAYAFKLPQNRHHQIWK